MVTTATGAKVSSSNSKNVFLAYRSRIQPRPEIFLTPDEGRWIDSLLGPGKPLCVIHPWGKTRSNVLSKDTWQQMIRSSADRYRFWQVGIEGHERIEGCERHLLLPKAFGAGA